MFTAKNQTKCLNKFLESIPACSIHYLVFAGCNLGRVSPVPSRSTVLASPSRSGTQYSLRSVQLEYANKSVPFIYQMRNTETDWPTED